MIIIKISICFVSWSLVPSFDDKNQRNECADNNEKTAAIEPPHPKYNQEDFEQQHIFHCGKTLEETKVFHQKYNVPVENVIQIWNRFVQENQEYNDQPCSLPWYGFDDGSML